jgi:hypothetical protein
VRPHAPDAIVEQLLSAAERRIRGEPETCALEIARIGGAIDALHLGGGLSRDDVHRWYEALRSRLRYEAASDNARFRFRGGGKQPGAVQRSVALDATVPVDLGITAVSVYSEGLGIVWKYRPDRPWRPTDRPPFGALPEHWPAHEQTPPPPAFDVVDTEGLHYTSHGWTLHGTWASWEGESYFVPSPPPGAGLVVSVDVRKIEVKLGTR